MRGVAWALCHGGGADQCKQGARTWTFENGRILTILIWKSFGYLENHDLFENTTEMPFYYIHNKEITSETENILTDLQDPHSVIVSFFTIFTKICVIFWDERFKLICRIFFLQLLSAILVFS